MSNNGAVKERVHRDTYGNPIGYTYEKRESFGGTMAWGLLLLGMLVLGGALWLCR